MSVTLNVNGVDHVVDDAREMESLLFSLREGLGLRGTKNACEQGECGSCSVFMDGVLVCACLIATGQADEAKIVTVEGLGIEGGPLHPIQQSFVDAGGVQCGFCTPGMIMSTLALLDADPAPDELTVREELAGNLCRCTGYQKILDAVNTAAERLGGFE